MANATKIAGPMQTPYNFKGMPETPKGKSLKKKALKKKGRSK
jgi:hypothetical protein